MHLIKLGLLLIMLGFTSISLAEERFACTNTNYRPVKTDFKLNLTKHSGPKLFFFKNIGKETVWLNHSMSRDMSAKAGWSSQLSPNHWSALLLNQRNFNLNCRVKKNGELRPVHCKKYLAVCELRKQLDPAMSGSYWFVENQDAKQFIPAVKKRLN